MPFGRYRAQFRRLVGRGVGALSAAAGAQRFAKKQMTRRKFKSGTSSARKSKSSLGRKLFAYPKGYSQLRDSDRIQQDLGSGGALTKEHVTIGRSNRKVSIKKLVNASKQTQILRFSAISPFMNTTTTPLNAQKTETGAGALWLHNFYDGVSTNSLPLHIYDLSSINNVINGTVTSHYPGSYMKMAAATGAVSWAALVGNLPNGAGTSAYWQYEDTASLGTNAGTQPLRQTLMDYVHARLMCYGSAKMATEYVIEIIQLKDDWLCPDIMGGTLPSSTGLNYKNSANQFWSSYVKSYCAHPVATTNPQSQKNYKVVKTIRFTLQPSLSIETDSAVGHAKQLNIFFRTNRTCKYDWAEDTIDPNVESGLTYPTEQGQLQLTVHPKARMYMTIRATNVTQLNNVVPSVDYTPSYDILLRKKYTTIQ